MITLFILNICFKLFCWIAYYSIILASNIIFIVLDFCYGFITGFVTSFITEYRKAKQAAIEKKERTLLEYYDN